MEQNLYVGRAVSIGHGKRPAPLNRVRSAHVLPTRRELFELVGGIAAYAAAAPGIRPQEAAKRTSGFLKIGSRRMAYRDYGGVGHNLLALHGTFSRGATFDPLAVRTA